MSNVRRSVDSVKLRLAIELVLVESFACMFFQIIEGVALALNFLRKLSIMIWIQYNTTDI